MDDAVASLLGLADVALSSNRSQKPAPIASSPLKLKTEPPMTASSLKPVMTMAPAGNLTPQQHHVQQQQQQQTIKNLIRPKSENPNVRIPDDIPFGASSLWNCTHV